MVTVNRRNDKQGREESVSVYTPERWLIRVLTNYELEYDVNCDSESEIRSALAAARENIADVAAKWLPLAETMPQSQSRRDHKGYV